jgi:23S rRNA (adenine2503-C2)-methyltransferase
MTLINLRDLTILELENFFVNDILEKKYRAKQVFEWINFKGAKSFSQMTDLPLSLRSRLDEVSCLGYTNIFKIVEDNNDGTKKFLIKLSDDNIIECVLMRYNHGNSLCISTQVGCAMGCKFCASTLHGHVRNLTPGELVEQILLVQDNVNERVNNITLMGIGEPLNNFDNLLKFMEIINSKHGIGMSHRRITLSTCGLVDELYRLADEKLQITVAVSLHAPNDEIRRKIMPVAKANCMEKLLKACRYYVKTTGRRITFEYSLMQGINDDIEYADILADKLRNMICHVNLINVNPTSFSDIVPVSIKRLKSFANRLNIKGINTTVRRTLGLEILAACGQLRENYIKNSW